MNRIKKEFRKKGYKLESDLPEIPYFVKGKSIFEPGYIFIEGISVDSEKATMSIFYNVIAIKYTMERTGEITELMID